jgi:hypothetical protein
MTVSCGGGCLMGSILFRFLRLKLFLARQARNLVFVGLEGCFLFDFNPLTHNRS